MNNNFEQEVAQMLQSKATEVEVSRTIPDNVKRGAIIRRSAIGAVGLAAMIAVVMGLASINSPAREELAPAEPDTPVESEVTSVQPLTAGFYEGGTYRTEDFRVPFTMTLPDGDRWRVFESTAETVTPGKESTGYLEVLSPKTAFRNGDVSKEIEAPADLVTWLTAHPALKVQRAGEVEVGGVKGELLRVAAKRYAPHHGLCDGQCLPLFPPLEGGHPYSIAIGKRPAEWRVFQVDKNPVIIGMVVEEPGFETELQTVLDSIRFE